MGSHGKSRLKKPMKDEERQRASVRDSSSSGADGAARKNLQKGTCRSITQLLEKRAQS